MAEAQGPIQYTTNHAYTVEAYSPGWPDWYTKEAALLKDIFGDIALDIQHVGSTAISGMAAKPQLDILVQVAHIETVDTVNSTLQEAGYRIYGDALGKGGRLFSRWKDGAKIVNLHVYEPAAHAVWEYLAVRDYLRSHPTDAKAYADLKLGLYDKYPNDYLKYREFKDPWIDELKRKILAREC